MHVTTRSGLTATAAASALLLSGCGENAGDGLTDITIAYAPWDECVVTSYLWEDILNEEGYNAQAVQMEPAAIYAGFETGDVDLFMCAIEFSHPDHFEEYGDHFDTVAEWFRPHLHGAAVPDYVDAESLEDLAGMEEDFGGQIIGIDPGSGLMQKMPHVTETYGLEDYELIEGSVASMQAELDRAIENEEYFVGLAGNPNWIFHAYDVRFLEDPDQAFGEEDIYRLVAGEEAQGDEELVALLSGFHMEDEELFALMAQFHDLGSGNANEAIEIWLEEPEHQETVDNWTE